MRKICKKLAIKTPKMHQWRHVLLAVITSSRLQMFFKISAFKNFTNFTGKHLCWSGGLQAYNFIKKRLQHMCFPVKFMKFLRTHFFKEHLWCLLLHHYNYWLCCYHKSISYHWSFSIPLKMSKNQRFSNVFRRYRKKPVVWFGLMLWFLQ